MLPYEETARAFWRDFAARQRSEELVDEQAVAQLARLLQHAVAVERQACAALAEEVMRLCGSHAAEQVAARIRARDQMDSP